MRAAHAGMVQCVSLDMCPSVCPYICAAHAGMVLSSVLIYVICVLHMQVWCSEFDANRELYKAEPSFSNCLRDNRHRFLKVLCIVPLYSRCISIRALTFENAAASRHSRKSSL